MHDKLILLVEDNPAEEALTLRALRKNDIDCEIAIARDGVEALDYIFGTGVYAERGTIILPHLTLLDLQLPKFGGIEVIKCLRADERTKVMPIVVLTTSSEEQDVVTSYSCGANSYVRKPVNFGQFVEILYQVGKYWLVLNEHPPKLT